MRYKINLIEKKEVGLLDKLTFFGLNYLRYIIVITQLVVIGVFFYRFQIDQRIIDLKEAVEQKKEIVQIVLPLLNEAAKIDKKTSIIDEAILEQKKFSEMVDYFFVIFFLLIFSVFIIFAIKPSLITAYSLKKEEIDLTKIDKVYEEKISN